MPTFESKPPSEAVKNGRSKLETLQSLLQAFAEKSARVTQSQVNFAIVEADKAIPPLEMELGLERDEHGIRYYTALNKSMYSRRLLALVNDLYEATGKIRA